MNTIFNRIFKLWMSVCCMLILVPTAQAGVNQSSQSKIVVAYVTSWSKIIPDPTLMTHINYAFGHVNNTFDGIKIDNEKHLREIVVLKRKQPSLKVLLSVGGWGSGRFSEMATSQQLRKNFADDCLRIVNEFDLDGIDIDWEYPTNAMANISASPEDTENFTLLMKDIRKAIGEDKLLTLASSASADYINFKAIMPYVDFVNIMAYDMASTPRHHAPLYASSNSGSLTANEAVRRHKEAGVPSNKLVLGMPFYGRGGKNKIPNFIDYKDIELLSDVTHQWDESAKVPYLADSAGNFVCGYENARSLKIKCDYVHENGLLGAMYWDYDGDNRDGDLRKTVYEGIMQSRNVYPANYATDRRFKALVYYSENVESAHVVFAKQAVEFFRRLNYGEGFHLDVTTDLSTYDDEHLNEYEIIVMLNAAPGKKSERDAFERYMENGGGWMGFHAAAYNDKNTRWPWLVNFLGGGVFYCNNWPPQPVLVEVDNQQHDVTKNLPASFVVPESEWYQWKPSPRENEDIEVLVSLSQKNYPLGIKDVVNFGDFPIVWTNKKYRMIYLNMGHGDDEFTDATQKLLFINAFRWVLSMDKKGDPFKR